MANVNGQQVTPHSSSISFYLFIFHFSNHLSFPSGCEANVWSVIHLIICSFMSRLFLTNTTSISISRHTCARYISLPDTQWEVKYIIIIFLLPLRNPTLRNNSKYVNQSHFTLSLQFISPDATDRKLHYH